MGMRKVLIDTNIYSAFKRNDPVIVSMFQHLDFIGINVTVLAELYVGFKGSKREKRNRTELEDFMNSSRVHFINHDRDTADFYAQIFDSLKKKGTPIPTNDIWIAASAIQSGLALFSLDNHFSYIDGLILQINNY
jgi:predicted nucleic acid-binding protein